MPHEKRKTDQIKSRRESNKKRGLLNLPWSIPAKDKRAQEDAWNKKQK